MSIMRIVHRGIALGAVRVAGQLSSCWCAMHAVALGLTDFALAVQGLGPVGGGGPCRHEVAAGEDSCRTGTQQG